MPDLSHPWLWLIGTIGIGGLIVILIGWPVIVAFLKTRPGQIVAGIVVAVLVALGMRAKGQQEGKASEKKRQEKENADFTKKVEEHDKELRNLPDDAARKRLRSKDGKPRVG